MDVYLSKDICQVTAERLADTSDLPFLRGTIILLLMTVWVKGQSQYFWQRAGQRVFHL